MASSAPPMRLPFQTASCATACTAAADAPAPCRLSPAFTMSTTAFVALNPLPRFAAPSALPPPCSKVAVRPVIQPRMSQSSEPFQQLWRYLLSQMQSQTASNPYQVANHVSEDPLPSHQATILSVQPITAALDLVQLTVDVAEARLNESYTTPGQFVALTFSDAKPSVLAVMASPPDPKSTQFKFLLSSKIHRALLRNAEQGATLSISDVMGRGISLNLPRGSNLHIFADSAQGFAAVSALLEWASFRTSTGEGCNRTSYINVYTAIPTHRSMPYAGKLSRWTAYGVSVFPVVSMGLVEFVNSATLGSQHKLANDQALACVYEEKTYNALHSSLVLCGFRKSLIHKLTARDFLRCFYERNVSPPSHSVKFETMPGDVYDEFMRAQFERNVWQSWVGVREDMRRDFERKWSARRRVNRDEATSQWEKANAWASWSAKNRDQWKKVEWDDGSWKHYWKSWDESRNRWRGENVWTSTNHKTWNQANAQQYWDWVQTGAGKGKTTGKGGNGSSSYDGYANGSWSRSTGWSGGSTGNSRGGYQRGYRYEYQETKRDDRSRSQNGGSNSGSNWGNGWKYNGSQRKSYSSGRSGYTNVRQGTDIDFYNILGINSGASRAEIKKAYRQKAMEHHPDRNPNNVEEAHVRMKQIVVAWTVLKDDQKRQRYDRYGSDGL
ncbi:Chaperone J-domain containing protein [Gracilaria domingensis]|nr:Chaperone J-domain containing protein [Gracilaria domingensis]